MHGSLNPNPKIARAVLALLTVDAPGPTDFRDAGMSDGEISPGLRKLPLDILVTLYLSNPPNNKYSPHIQWHCFGNIHCELSCLSCLVHSHMLVPAVTFSPQAPHSADLSGTAEVAPH